MSVSQILTPLTSISPSVLPSGVATLVAGTITVPVAGAGAGSRVLITPKTVPLGTLTATAAPNSITITSTNVADVPVVSWLLIR